MTQTYDHLQRDYYAKTAAAYDRTHVGENDEHALALRFMISLMHQYGLRSVLDVGSGTGRAVRGLIGAGFEVTGIEPVRAMIDVGLKHGIPADAVIEGQGQSLPFADGSFDAVCEFGVLHHIRQPDEVIREMMRVSRRAVFLSDTNRFGRAGLVSRLSKLLLWKTRMWPAAYYVWTRGKNCDISDCDGIAYSYSVYDSLDRLDEWADRVLLLPTKCEGRRFRSWFHPLLTSSNVLLCAIKDEKA